MPQGQRGELPVWRAVFGPSDLENDVFEIAIAIMPVGVPAARSQVDFDVTGPGLLLAKLDYSAAKIRSAFNVAKAGVQHADGLAIGGAELFAQQSLMLPDRLQQR